MFGAVVPYARFLEVRQRRQRVLTELMQTRRPVIADPVVISDDATGTLPESQTACGVRHDAADTGETG